jgi:hypothetical protein
MWLEKCMLEWMAIVCLEELIMAQNTVGIIISIQASNAELRIMEFRDFLLHQIYVLALKAWIFTLFTK